MSALTCPFLFQRVPDVAVEVVITTQKKTSTLAERHASDAADDVVVREHADLLIGANVEKTAGGVVTAGAKGVAAGEEGYRVDVRLVTRERLFAVAVPNVPQLRRRKAKQKTGQ